MFLCMWLKVLLYRIESNIQLILSFYGVILWYVIHIRKPETCVIHVTETIKRTMKHAMSVCRLIVQDN